MISANVDSWADVSDYLAFGLMPLGTVVILSLLAGTFFCNILQGLIFYMIVTEGTVNKNNLFG